MTLVLAVYSLHFLRYGIVFPLIPLMAEDMGAGPSIIGLVVGSFSLISLLLAVPTGGLADRFGIKQLLLIGAFCNIVSAAILMQAETVAELIAAQLLGGLAFQLYVVGTQTSVSHLTSASRRERLFGHLSFSAAAGQTFGPVMGGLLVHQVGYQVTFLAALVLSTGGLSILARGEKAQLLEKETSYSLKRDLRQARTFVSDARFLMLLSFTFFIVFAASLRSSFLPVLLRTRGLSEAHVGFLISLFAGTSTIVRIFFGRLVQTIRRKTLLGVSFLVVVAGVGLIPLAPSVIGLAVFLALFGIGFGITQPLSMVMMADLTEPEHSGLSMGLRFTSILLANLLGPIAFGFVAESFGLASSFFFAAAAVAAMGFNMLVWKPKLLPKRRDDKGLNV